MKIIKKDDGWEHQWFKCLSCHKLWYLGLKQTYLQCKHGMASASRIRRKIGTLRWD